MTFATKLAILGGLASTALAHGTVWGYTADGVYHENFHPNAEAGEVPEAAGWYSENADRGFVSVGDYQDPDIICHRGARPSEYSATVAAGGTVDFHWTPWDASHEGPVLTYVANCGDDCADADKEALEWVKIDEMGKNDEGEWAAVQLIGTNNTWTTTVPETLAPGKYVFRHEIISLAGTQHYPSCINIEITGDGTDEPEGVIGTELYTEDDAADPGKEYVVPGPELYTPGPSPSASESGEVDPTASSTIPAQSAAPTGTGIPSSAATPSSTFASESSAVTSTAPTSTGASSAAATPSEASSESSAAPSTTSEASPVTSEEADPVTTDEASPAPTDEASPAPTDEVVSQPAVPSATPCTSKNARRHARDVRM